MKAQGIQGFLELIFKDAIFGIIVFAPWLVLWMIAHSLLWLTHTSFVLWLIFNDGLPTKLAYRITIPYNTKEHWLPQPLLRLVTTICDDVQSFLQQIHGAQYRTCTNLSVNISCNVKHGLATIHSLERLTKRT